MQARNSMGGKSLGAGSLMLSTLASCENLKDVRKRSSSKNRNSHLKTPISQSQLQHMSSSSRKTGSTSKNRGSIVVPDSRATKDTRPLRDKHWQTEQVKNLIDFLREHNYPNRELTSKSFPLSASEFRCLFNFLYGILSPGYVLPQKFESELTSLLKGLDYPGVISKSTFVTIGSLHSWPSILGVIVFIKEMVVYYLERKSQSFFVKVDEKRSGIRRYGNDFEQEIKELESKLLDHLDLNPQDLQTETNHLDSLRQKKELMAKDREYFMDYKAKYIDYTEKKANELQNMKKKNETLLEEIKTLEQTIELNKNDSGAEELTPENHKARFDSLEEIYSNINNEIRITDEDICVLEIQISKLKVKSDVVIREFNTYIEELEEFSLPKISDIEDFDEEYHSNLLVALSSKKKKLRQIQDEVETDLSSINTIKLEVGLQKEELNNLMKELELQKMEFQNIERNMKEEEINLDSKILSLKDKCYNLDQKNHSPQIRSLIDKFNKLEGIRDQKREKLDERKQEIEEFLESAMEISCSYVEKMTQMNTMDMDKKIESLKSSLGNDEKLLRKMNKHIQFLKDREKFKN
ncbi:NDC80 [Lepeophtheirus salmonis]|uniref:Kinetochore protein NDC80 n=2 Tax=Lepeophtheirus salmonis TaxID=72036 RepID=A0A7R8CY70_LEPSM|nr:NDC80 [Lepeophtheirus salmonis]CAF2967638.1 NDC80 [Lepeophtheirus salmonis]